MSLAVDVLVIGSGAGGATTALTLAEGGLSVVVLEEGEWHSTEDYGRSAPHAMRHLYRRRGMNPIMGRVPIGFVEGRCVGGSTETNSGFWHRTPREILLRWKAQVDLDGASEAELAPHFTWAEALLGVGTYGGDWPESTALFARGTEAMGWDCREVPRAAPGCVSTNACASGCPTGAKQGMSQQLLPRAKAAGARVLSRCRVKLLLLSGGRATGVLAELTREDGTRELVRIDAEHVFICGGPAETPALLRRSGLKARIGDTLQVHPMLKLAARFPQTVDADKSVLPLVQVKEFWPDLSMGGGFFSRGHLAMLLSDNWPALAPRMADSRNMASYYVAVRGTGRGTVRPSVLGDGETNLRYELSVTDLRNLSQGLARLATVMFAAGAIEVYPAVQGLPVIKNELEAVTWLDRDLPARDLSLTTVHAFSSCPIGERQDLTAADSYGKVHKVDNLYVNDASMLPDSPGVNPQGSVMALARRNALHFLAR